MASAASSGMKGTIAIGNGAGFWGDNLDAPYLLARDGAIDVLTLEYLAELTMAILSHLRAKDKRAGFVTDFPELLERLVPILRDKEQLAVVTNAGGLNPLACAVRCGEVFSSGGLGETPIGVITGDDVLDQIPDWLESGVDLDNLETGEPLTNVVDRLVAANVYLGARPIAECRSAGSRVVISGRVADASLTVGPVAARFGWSWDDWDRLAGATVAGHLIECGAQATGGLWRGWDKAPDLAGVGYPVAEIEPDGSFVITKPTGTGGQVNVETVTEQLLYEIDDPARYHTPDVDADFTGLSLKQVGPIASRSPERAARRNRIGSRWWQSIATGGRRAASWLWSGAMRSPRHGPPVRSCSKECAEPGSPWRTVWSSAWEQETWRPA